MKKISQVKQITEYMLQGNHITPLEALNLFGSLRLAAVIFIIKERGWKVQSATITTTSGKRVSEYWINPEDRQLVA